MFDTPVSNCTLSGVLLSVANRTSKAGKPYSVISFFGDGQIRPYQLICSSDIAEKANELIRKDVVVSLVLLPASKGFGLYTQVVGIESAHSAGSLPGFLDIA